MPRRSKGARLHLRPARYRAGKLTHQATWVIRDGTGYYATGCAEREVAAAEQVLKDYIAKKYAPTRKEQDLEKIPVARRFAAYATAHRGNVIDTERYRPMASRRVSRHERRNVVARVRAPPPGPPEGCRRQDDGQTYRLSFASETNRKEENERRQNSMKMGTSSGNTASFHRS